MLILLTLMLQITPDEFPPVDYLVQCLQEDSMYSDPFPGDIMIILEREDSTDHYFDFALREDHEGGAGDPATCPVIDRFRVYADGTILWFSPLPGMYISWEDYIAGITGL